MILDIYSFNDFKNKHFKLPNGQLCLLKGPSGSGKTSVLQAIVWTLYGGPSGDEKWHVVLKYANLKIVRKSKPSTIQVLENKSKDALVAEIAQAVIDKKFGSKDLFNLCCHIVNEHNKPPSPIFSPDQKDQLYYISKLAFKDYEDPLVLIDKIRERKKIEKRAYQIALQQYEDKLAQFTTELNERPINAAVKLSTLEKIQSDLSSIKSTVEQLKKKSWEQQRLNQDITEINTSIKKLKSSIENLERATKTATETDDTSLNMENQVINLEKTLKTINNNILDTEKQIRGLEQSILIKQKIIKRAEHMAKITTVKNKLSALGCINIVNNFDERSLLKLENDHKQYAKESSSAIELGIEYSNDALAKEKDRVLKNIKYNEQKRNYKQFVDTKKLYEDLPNVDVDTMEQQLFSLKSGLDLLVCPKCDAHLRLKNKQLVVEERDLVDPNLVIQHENHLREAKKTHSLKQKHGEALSSMKKTNYHTFIPNEEYEKNGDAFLTKRLERLSSIKMVIKPSYTIEEGKLLVEYGSLITKINKISEETSQDGKSINDVDLEINNLKIILEARIDDKNNVNGEIMLLTRRINDRKMFMVNAQKIVDLKQQMSQMEEKKQNMDNQIERDTNDRLNETLKKLTETEKLLDDYKYYERMRKVRAKLIEEHESVEEKKEDLHALMNLYNIAVTEHHNHLCSVLESINSCVNNCFSEVFEYPMSILFSVFQEDKKKKYKNKITMRIMRKGKDVNNGRLNRGIKISTGEMKRIVLLVIIALNVIYKCPILLMDEPLASLDPETRAHCLAIMRRYLGGRTIICAEHNAEECDYDNTTTLEINRTVMAKRRYKKKQP